MTKHMDIMQDAVSSMKYLLENAVLTSMFKEEPKKNGLEAKTSLIRSQGLINMLHEAIKKSLIVEGVYSAGIYPPLGCTRPELQLTAFREQKKQDICVVPANIERMPTLINWGPLTYKKKIDPYGFDYTEQTLSINVRSQLSSISKNVSTLVERTGFEVTDLHDRYPRMVLGDVYLIPTHEYDFSDAANNKFSFSKKTTDLQRYISEFYYFSNRNSFGNNCCYERCALIVVDFSKEIPLIYNSTDELKRDGLIPEDFDVELADISYNNFITDLLKVYQERFGLANLKIN